MYDATGMTSNDQQNNNIDMDSMNSIYQMIWSAMGSGPNDEFD